MSPMANRELFLVTTAIAIEKTTALLCLDAQANFPRNERILRIVAIVIHNSRSRVSSSTSFIVLGISIL